LGKNFAIFSKNQKLCQLLGVGLIAIYKSLVQGNDKLVPGFLGIALCEGYDSMGFQMSKPNLRAELEADLKSICQGNKNPAVVLQEQIGKYRLVFELATAQVEKIEAACTKYLTGQ